MRRIECEQGSAEWLKLRCGRITASRICDVMARLKSGAEAAARRNYRLELMAARLTGRSGNHFVSDAMRWGTEQEQFARVEYELQTGAMVDQVGLVLHPDFDWAAASPDGLVAGDGGVEIKCPETATHISWLMSGEIPEDYVLQMQWNMRCTERSWWDFVSYDPRIVDKRLQLLMTRIDRDEALIVKIEAEVTKLHGEVTAALAGIGAPEWQPLMARPLDAELNAVTVKIGELDVPGDLSRLFDQEVVP